MEMIKKKNGEMGENPGGLVNRAFDFDHSNNEASSEVFYTMYSLIIPF